MAKIAGRKNDGAWYRTNRVIQTLNLTQRDALKVRLEGMATITSWFEMIQEFQDKGGIDSGDPSYIISLEALTEAYSSNGIPRQAWYGLLTYDTYTRTGTAPDYVYTPDHQDIAFGFGKELRDVLKDFMFARRQGIDLANLAIRELGNPGGIANATEGD